MCVSVPDLITGDLTRPDWRRVAHFWRRTFLTPDHQFNSVQWVTDKLRWNLRTWRRIYWPDDSRFLLRFTDGCARVWHQRGQYPCQDNVAAETEMFGGGFIMVWGCFSHDHKLDLILKWLHTLWQDKVTLTISFSLLCTHIFEHIKLHVPFFRTTMPVRIGPVLLQNLLPRKGLRNFSGLAEVPIWIPSNAFETVLDVTSTNEWRRHAGWSCTCTCWRLEQLAAPDSSKTSARYASAISDLWYKGGWVRQFMRNNIPVLISDFFFRNMETSPYPS